MNKNTKLALVALASAGLVIGSVASPAQAATTYTLAFQGPLTGDAAQAGQDEIAGAKYAIAEFQKANPTIKIKLIQVDDQGSGTQSAIVSPGIAKNKAVIGVIGSAYSGATENSFPSYKAAKMPMVSPSASRVTLTTPQAPDFGGPVFHRVVANDSVQGPALARLAIKGVTAPAVYTVDDQSPYGVGLKQYVLNGVVKGKTVGADSILPAPGTDWSAIVAKVKAAKANVVIYCGYDIDAGAFVKALRDGGYTGVFATGDGSATSSFPKAAGNAAAEGSRITQADIPFDLIATPAQKAAFTKASGVKVAGGYVTTTINATNVFLQCIKQGKTTRAALLPCINGGTFKNFAGGTFSFEAWGDIKGGAPVGAYSVKAGVIVYDGIA